MNKQQGKFIMFMSEKYPNVKLTKFQFNIAMLLYSEMRGAGKTLLLEKLMEFDYILDDRLPVGLQNLENEISKMEDFIARRKSK